MKTSITGLVTGLFLLCLVGLSSATVVYEFEFYDLSSGFDNFNITLSYPDYVTVTGMPLLPTTQTTPLGYSVMYAGTSKKGIWGFDDDGSATLTDSSFRTNGLAFNFAPNTFAENYFTSLGTYAGLIYGNGVSSNGNTGSFSGQAKLTLAMGQATDPAPVPEPGTLLLLGSGLAGLALYRRRMNKA